MEQYNDNPCSELTYGNNCPHITIQWKKGNIYISNAVFKLIGNPSGIRLQWNATKRILIIEATDINDPNGFPLIGHLRAHKYICSVTLVHKIWATAEWNKTLCFKIMAKYNERYNVAIFEMKDAFAAEIQKNIHDEKIY